MSRFILTNAADQTEAAAGDLAVYLLSGNAPVNATTGQVRAAARLFSGASPVLRDLANGESGIDADALYQAVVDELAKNIEFTVGTLALQSIGNWLLVGARYEEVTSA